MNKIIGIAGRVAMRHVGQANLERVLAEPATDSDGREALRIIVILKPGAADRLTGDATLNLLVDMQNTFFLEGESRFPIVEYATEEELLDDDDVEEVSPGLRR